MKLCGNCSKMQLKVLMDCMLGVGLLLFTFGGIAQGKSVVEIDDYFRQCGDGKVIPGVDLSGLESPQDDEGNSLLHGRMVYKKAYNPPIKMKIHTERFKQGSWTSGEISRDVDDICPLLMSRAEPWYIFTSLMKQQECPYEAGHVETFDMAKVGDMGLDIPEHFEGDWKMYVDVTTTRDDKEVTECFMIAFSIKEI
ncbi:uncharacterized protein LOC129780068 [Toxorhynchites rutilus septentrionalis]|uniref:uncharacterized protein LOC129780068 n=1 Tax=Toxorhynchites rutilus septentrionalis TaxID=329112 RepID=UPI002478DA86|nr:uncharacterized protein LOC129780068 [Toxorhynchites rutilus septentrionalis]